jgi:hypothetical protein
MMEWLALKKFWFKEDKCIMAELLESKEDHDHYHINEHEGAVFGEHTSLAVPDKDTDEEGIDKIDDGMAGDWQV